MCVAIHGSCGNYGNLNNILIQPLWCGSIDTRHNIRNIVTAVTSGLIMGGGEWCYIHVSQAEHEGINIIKALATVLAIIHIMGQLLKAGLALILG